jgi:hypothetical protein
MLTSSSRELLCVYFSLVLELELLVLPAQRAHFESPALREPETNGNQEMQSCGQELEFCK